MTTEPTHEQIDRAIAERLGWEALPQCINAWRKTDGFTSTANFTTDANRALAAAAEIMPENAAFCVKLWRNPKDQWVAECPYCELQCKAATAPHAVAKMLWAFMEANPTTPTETTR